MDDGVITFHDYFQIKENLIANLNELLSQIERSDTALVDFDGKSKECLFYLGMLFANGIRIKLANEDAIGFEDEGYKKSGKSFPAMVYVWSKLFDPEWQGVEQGNDLQKLLVNIKRLGLNLKLRKVPNYALDGKLFLICPVRDSSEQTKEWIKNYKKIMSLHNYDVHAPYYDTIQEDKFAGYAICRDNAEAIGRSEEVAVLYDQKSYGSVFDLGVAYALRKPIVLLNANEIVFKDDDVIDQIIKRWPFNENSRTNGVKNAYSRVRNRIKNAFYKVF